MTEHLGVCLRSIHRRDLRGDLLGAEALEISLACQRKPPAISYQARAADHGAQATSPCLRRGRQ